MKPIPSSLEHRVILPEHLSGAAQPAVIMLHGRGADEEDLLGLSQYLDERLIVISARAPFPYPYGGYTWYEAGPVGAPEPKMFRVSCDALAAFIPDAIANYPVDAKKVFLFGFSMGSVMSYAYALTNPDRITGVIAHSGYVPEGTDLIFRWNELQGTAFFIAHGVEDPVIPVDFARRARMLFTNSNVSVVYKEYPIAHQISDESLSDLSAWLKERLDHAPQSPRE
jgi:phospholipase/carboxylesterase